MENVSFEDVRLPVMNVKGRGYGRLYQSRGRKRREMERTGEVGKLVLRNGGATDYLLMQVIEPLSLLAQ
jgi:hypothetical protein